MIDIPPLVSGSPAARAVYQLVRGDRIVTLRPEPGRSNMDAVAEVLLHLFEKASGMPSVVLLAPSATVGHGGLVDMQMGFERCRISALRDGRQYVTVLMPNGNTRWIDLWTAKANQGLIGTTHKLVIVDAQTSGEYPGWGILVTSQILAVTSAAEDPVTDRMRNSILEMPHPWRPMDPELILAGAE